MIFTSPMRVRAVIRRETATAALITIASRVAGPAMATTKPTLTNILVPTIEPTPIMEAPKKPSSRFRPGLPDELSKSIHLM